MIPTSPVTTKKVLGFRWISQIILAMAGEVRTPGLSRPAPRLCTTHLPPTTSFFFYHDAKQTTHQKQNKWVAMHLLWISDCLRGLLAQPRSNIVQTPPCAKANDPLTTHKHTNHNLQKWFTPHPLNVSNLGGSERRQLIPIVIITTSNITV